MLASLQHAAEDGAWSDIQVAGDELAERLRTVDQSELLHGPDSIVSPGAELLQGRSRQSEITLVNRDWRVLWHVAQRPGQQPTWQPRDQLGWTPSPRSDSHPSDTLRGRITVADGEHLAIACPLEGQAGFVLLHRPIAAVHAFAASVRPNLLGLGVVTFLWTCALLSMTAYLILARSHEVSCRERAQSTSDGLRQTQRLVRTRDGVIFALARLAESRDPDTGGHLERIARYSTLLASPLGRHTKYAHEVTPAFVRLIEVSSVLHDIGKVGIEDSILLKRGPLDPTERRRMELHTLIAARCLDETSQRMGGSDFLEMARQIAVAHHERWDGTGYPHGLRGAEIPLAARIVAIADVFDALATRRPYKEPIAHDRCVAIIREGAGSQFDPDLVEQWLRIEHKFREIASRSAASSYRTEDVGPPEPGFGPQAEDKELAGARTRDEQAEHAAVPATASDWQNRMGVACLATQRTAP
ncbi:MAG: HD domain-containing protein [Planctomycetes bacterium]|nr:HD domain-containing protein [Planctomycetota bacterium]